MKTLVSIFSMLVSISLASISFVGVLCLVVSNSRRGVINVENNSLFKSMQCPLHFSLNLKRDVKGLRVKCKISSFHIHVVKTNNGCICWILCLMKDVFSQSNCERCCLTLDEGKKDHIRVEKHESSLGFQVSSK